MCGRYYIEIDDAEINDLILQAEKEAKRTPITQPPQLPFTGGEIFPGACVPVLTKDGPTFMKWGFPSLNPARPALINARSETAASLKTFAESMESRRCLIPATTYYEWQDVGKKRKLKYEFFLKERETFYMAAIFTPNYEFAILTKAATVQFTPIHDRMPVVISPEYQQKWLEETANAMDAALEDFSFTSNFPSLLI